MSGQCKLNYITVHVYIIGILQSIVGCNQIIRRDKSPGIGTFTAEAVSLQNDAVKYQIPNK